MRPGEASDCLAAGPGEHCCQGILMSFEDNSPRQIVTKVNLSRLFHSRGWSKRLSFQWSVLQPRQWRAEKDMWDDLSLACRVGAHQRLRCLGHFVLGHLWSRVRPAGVLIRLRWKADARVSLSQAAVSSHRPQQLFNRGWGRKHSFPSSASWQSECPRGQLMLQLKQRSHV